MRDTHTGEVSPPVDAALPRAPIKLILVGARLLTEALAVCLESDDEIEVIGVYPDPVGAIDHAREAEPDIIVLDDTTAHLDATRLISLLRGAQAHVRIVVLSIALDRRALANYVRAGAVGCITVDQPFVAFVESLKQVRNGQVLFEADELIGLLAATRPVRGGSALAPRELEVLRVLATGKSTEDAAAELGISVHTLRTHLKRCITKMEARSKLEAIIRALQAGLIELPR